MSYVPGQIEVQGEIANNETAFATWIARNDCHAMILKQDLAIVECQMGKEEQMVGDLSATRPFFIKSVSRVEILPIPEVALA
jgi:hypothetical protein